jgi:hypothetical protein
VIIHNTTILKFVIFYDTANWVSDSLYNDTLKGF